MSSTSGEVAVQNLLESWGFTVTRISNDSRGSQECPDFLVADGVTQYVIEVKDREDQKLMSLFDSQTLGEKIVEIEYDNRISGIIAKGVRQLDAYSGLTAKFSLLWFFVDASLFSSLISRQIAWTLYGLRNVEGYTTKNEFFQAYCYYFTYSDFYKYPELDAVVIQEPNQVTLCTNDFSSSCDELRRSKFYQIFESRQYPIIEPSRMERDQRCLVADDFSINRKDGQLVGNYICKKYHLRKMVALQKRVECFLGSTEA